LVKKNFDVIKMHGTRIKNHRHGVYIKKAYTKKDELSNRLKF